MGGAGGCPYMFSEMTYSCHSPYRLAFSLCGAHGCGVVVHYGFLRASLFSIIHITFDLAPGCFTQIIMFSDLECDYINPIDLCNKLNQVNLPSFSDTGFLVLIPPVSSLSSPRTSPTLS